MNKMKKILLVFVLSFIPFYAFSVSAGLLAAYPEYIMYDSVQTKKFDYEFDILFSNELKKAVVLCVNTSEENDRTILLETKDPLSWFGCALSYSDISETLYFYLNGSENENGVYNYQGLYSCKKTDGKFIPENINRYFIPNEWMMNRAINYYLLVNNDYDGFLNYIYSISDNCEKTLCVKTDDGELLTEAKALGYIIDNNLIYTSPWNFLNTYLKRIENGKITDKSAYTLNGNVQLADTILDAAIHDSYFLKNSEGIWILNAINREEKHSNADGTVTSSWVHDYYNIYLLEDAAGKIASKTPDAISSVQIIPDDEAVKKGRTVQNDYLVFQDRNTKKFCAYKNDNLVSFTSYDEAIAYTISNPVKDSPKTNKQIKKTQNTDKKSFIYIIAAVFAALALAELAYIIYLKSKSYKTHLNKKDKKMIFKIQDEERSKVSKDIHDSVVQNIRAIRLDAEMLEVQEDSNQRKQKIVDEMTNVISLLRNICYNLSPAELSLAENMDNTNVELLSVIDTLSKQFTAKTKIPCSINLEKDVELPELDVEVSKNVVRVVQECFANIEKHSFATRVQILVKNEIKNDSKQLIIFIIDDGIGCEVKNLTSKKTHFGIRNMIERMNMIGGTIEFFSEPNEGLNIQLQIPYESKVE